MAAGPLGCGWGRVRGLMAKVLGESGRYVSQEATKRLHALLALAIITMAALGGIWGFMVRSSLPVLTLTPASSLLLSVALVLLMLLVARVAFRRMDELEKERKSLRNGAAGEKSVAHTLSKLPDDFRVVNDVQTPTGNLDHVVIGPTGVFVIETKACRGIIGADGKGELTLNGKPARKAHVNRLVGRMMETRDRIQVLAPGADHFFQAVIVFTSAWVEAKFGTTGRAYCISDDRLVRHILENKPSRRLSALEVAVLAHAFASLAQMDPDFCTKAQPALNGKKTAASGCLLAEPARA
jgi:hypothetical protein